jgi:hypothetical protein
VQGASLCAGLGYHMVLILTVKDSMDFFKEVWYHVMIIPKGEIFKTRIRKHLKISMWDKDNKKWTVHK